MVCLGYVLSHTLLQSQWTIHLICWQQIYNMPFGLVWKNYYCHAFQKTCTSFKTFCRTIYKDFQNFTSFLSMCTLAEKSHIFQLLLHPSAEEWCHCTQQPRRAMCTPCLFILVCIDTWMGQGNCLCLCCCAGVQECAQETCSHVTWLPCPLMSLCI